MAGWQELSTAIVRMPPASEGSWPFPGSFCGPRLEGAEAQIRTLGLVPLTMFETCCVSTSDQRTTRPLCVCVRTHVCPG